MIQRPDCRKCGAQLNGDVDETGVTVCPGCSKRWQLTPDHAAIASTTLEIHDATHAAETDFVRRPPDPRGKE